MASVDAILAAPSLVGLARVNAVGGDREVTDVCLAEMFADLETAAAGSLVILGRAASAEATDYRFDMALRWATLRGVAAVAAFAEDRWHPPLTAVDIASRAGVALISIHVRRELTGLLLAMLAEVGGGPALALHKANAAARLADAERKARELPIRSRSELLAELLISESALTEDLLERARQLGVALTGWHLAVRIEADNLTDVTPDEIGRFELLESAGQVALGAAAATGGTWYLSRIARAIVLIWMTSSDPGAQAGQRAARSAARALEAISARVPALRLRAGVSTSHEGPLGLRAAAAEARRAVIAARAAGKPPGVSAHDATGVQRMLMEWYASDTARASVRVQLAPLERLGPSRCETALRTLAAFLDEQGSIGRTAQRLHLHRNAVTYRMRNITTLLGVDLDDPDQRLALQLACRARLSQE
jgi:sugar diacid utilization regulator